MSQGHLETITIINSPSEFEKRCELQQHCYVQLHTYLTYPQPIHESMVYPLMEYFIPGFEGYQHIPGPLTILVQKLFAKQTDFWGASYKMPIDARVENYLWYLKLI